MTKVAVVTGSNKGIGFAIVRALCKKFDGDVYLTARNADLGKQAIEELKKEGLKPHFHQLEIDNNESVVAFATYIKDNYGGLDVLVNNAAIAFKTDDKTPFHIQATETNRINYFSTLNLCDHLFPLLRPHARVVNMSSRAGLLKIIKSEEIRKKYLDSNLTIETITTILNQFIDATKEDKHQSLGFPNSAYGMSKVSLTAASFVQQRILQADKSRADIVVNACCPGYVATDMSSHLGPLTIDQGAETPVYLALLPENITEPKGKFLAEKKIIDWASV